MCFSHYNLDNNIFSILVLVKVHWCSKISLDVYLISADFVDRTGVVLSLAAFGNRWFYCGFFS